GPDDAALLEADLILLGLADDRRGQLASERRRAEVSHPEHVAFLVDERADDETSVERRAASLDRRPGDHRGREAALHVGGPAPVDPAVDQLGAERRVRPLARIALGDDVGVALEQEAWAPVAVAEPGDDVGPSGRDLVDLDAEPLLSEPAL